MKRQLLLALLALLIVFGFILWRCCESVPTPTPLQQLENGGLVPAPQERESSDTTFSILTTDSLDLSGQGLTKVPEYVFTKTNLESLDLSENKLSGALQAEVRHLENLRVLDLSDNQFTGVPAEIGQLKNLEILDLSNNRLTGLPYELGNLRNLKVLRLSGNSYSEADLGVIRASLPASVTVETE